MNPQQPAGYGFPAPPSNNPYDFITNPQAKPPRRGGLASGGGSLVAKLAIAGGGAVVIGIAVVLIVNVVFGNRTNFAPLLSLAETQQEIIRTAQKGTQQGTVDDSIAGAAMNTRLTVLTQQRRVLVYLGAHHQKIDQKTLSLKKNTKTDAEFQEAIASSTFNTVFAQTLRQELTDYATELRAAYKSAPGPEAKKLITADFEQTQLLLKQLPEK